MPFKLLTCLLWLTVTRIGIWSPLRKPPFKTSIVAVMIFPLTVAREPLPDMNTPASVTVLTERIPYSVPEAPLLLSWLAKLVSLGDGLRGPAISSKAPFRVSLPETGRGASVPVGVGGTLSALAVSGRVRGGLVLFRREMGSKEITLGFGSAIGAMSMVSRRATLTSHVVVGDIVVGRVNVEVSM